MYLAWATSFAFAAISIAHAQTPMQMAAAQTEHLKHWGYLSVSWNPSWTPVTAAQAVQLEQQLDADPENPEARIQLLTYYFHNDLRRQRVDSVCWLIEHRPESPILSLDTTWIFSNSGIAGEHYKPALNTPADFERVRDLWRSILALDPTDPEILHNAARFLWNNPPDRAEAVALAKRLRQLDPLRHGVAVDEFLSRAPNRGL